MAREEQDREDLLAEAKALVQRVEIELPKDGTRVVMGFRRDGCGSIYFNAEPAYHFNSRNELRRAYADGQLLKAERGRLIALRRVRTADEVQLLRHELTDEETAELVAKLSQRWEALDTALRSDDFHAIGQVPEHADVLGHCRTWLQRVTMPARIAANARAL